MSKTTDANVLDLTAQIAAAHVENNHVATDALPYLIQSVYRSLATISAPKNEQTEPQLPAVPIKRSVFPDFIVCLEDGRKLKTLKRHLKSHYNLSPAQYRAKWGLLHDYPIVAPNYAAARSILAKNIGLGRKRLIEADEPKGAELKKPNTKAPSRPTRGLQGYC